MAANNVDMFVKKFAGKPAYRRGECFGQELACRRMTVSSHPGVGRARSRQTCELLLFVSICKESRNPVENHYVFMDKYKYVQAFHSS